MTKYVFFPGAAALLNFESNRLMGPNIAGALSSMTPVLAVLLAVVMLGERVRGLSYSAWEQSLLA
jgi:drug/metabolite transporter (DMT)-like permease